MTRNLEKEALVPGMGRTGGRLGVGTGTGGVTGGVTGGMAGGAGTAAPIAKATLLSLEAGPRVPAASTAQTNRALAPARFILEAFIVKSPMVGDLLWENPLGRVKSRPVRIPSRKNHHYSQGVE
jgi:hypothetical protein